jgi:UDP-N-acetylmuramate dehydrogenase
MDLTGSPGTEAASLVADLGIAHEVDAPLGPRTWYGVGGSAEVLAHPTNESELAKLVARCAEGGVPIRVIGEGANLLVADRGVPGVVVELDAQAFRGIDLTGATVTAGGGASLAKVIVATAREGLAGLEVLAGIPASIGGAVRMNCGGRYGQIGDTLDEVDLITPAGERKTVDRTALDFGYRRSAVGDSIVVRARFGLRREDPAEVRRRMKSIFAYKKSTQPLADRSAGCAFKNPPAGRSEKGAGQLIDEAGLKGLSLGGASVSSRHANFLVVEPNGSADALIELIETVRQRVAAHCGVELEREVVIWPTDLGPASNGGESA